MARIEPFPGSNTLPDQRVDADVVVRFRHRLIFTTNAFSPANAVLDEVIREGGNLPARIVFVVDSAVVQRNPDLLDRIEGWAAAHDATVRAAARPLVIPGGEVCKNDPAVLRSVQRLMEHAGLCRQSYVVAIGGGAVLDVVGCAASLLHRGVRLIRFPTTTLGQCDSGVGVKNGVNVGGKKNWIGTFAVPWAVINDEGWLGTLSGRDWRAGFSEALKVALLKDVALYDQLRSSTAALRRRDSTVAIPILRRAAELHLAHIAGSGDPFEMTTARPLDFGHWSAHKLEQITDFDVRHGEAVAIGLAIDTAYAAACGIADWSLVDDVTRCLDGLGFEIYHEALADSARLLEGIEEFRQHLGGRLTITLIESPGHPIEVHEIDEDRMCQAVCWLAERYKRPADTRQVGE